MGKLKQIQATLFLLPDKTWRKIVLQLKRYKKIQENHVYFC